MRNSRALPRFVRAIFTVIFFFITLPAGLASGNNCQFHRHVNAALKKEEERRAKREERILILACSVMNFYDRSLSLGVSDATTESVIRTPLGRNFRNESARRERRREYPRRKEVFSSSDSPVPRQGEMCERLSSTWPYSISLANAVRMPRTCTDAHILRTFVCVRWRGLKRGSGEPRKRTRERTRRSCREFTAHTPVPPSQFVTDEAIGNKQRGDSNCLSFSAVVHWVLSSR